MYADVPSIASGVTNVDLTFQHKLSKIILQLKDEQNNAVTGATVSIDNQCVNGALNVADGVVSVAADATYTSELTFAEGENGQYEVIVIPDEGREGRSIVITTTEGNTYRCPIGSIAFGNSQKYTFPVSLQAPASSGGETTINLDMVSLDIDDWDEGKTVGWIVSPGTELITTTKTEKKLATARQLTANRSLQIPASSMTLAATDVYCIEYSRTTDASAAATLTVAPLTQRSTDTKEFSLPLGVIEGKIVFAVGAFTGGVTLSSNVDLTLDVSVYSENESEGGDTETPSEPSEIEVWTGPHDLVNWNGTSVQYRSNILAQTTVGSILRFYYSEKQEGAQIQFAGETIDVTDNLEYVDMPVTQEMITTLTDDEWTFLNGQNITVTRIVLLIQPAEV